LKLKCEVTLSCNDASYTDPEYKRVEVKQPGTFQAIFKLFN